MKSLAEAAAGRQLSKAAIAARHAAPGAFVAARRRVFGNARSVYGRGGGIFGLAMVSDRLMERWMANAQLNANQKVAKWLSEIHPCVKPIKVWTLALEEDVWHSGAL